jgi:hypothetical protein
MKSIRYYQNLIKRRNGIINAIKLQIRFHKIGQDKYVKQYREGKK